MEGACVLEATKLIIIKLIEYHDFLSKLYASLGTEAPAPVVDVWPVVSGFPGKA